MTMIVQYSPEDGGLSSLRGGDPLVATVRRSKTGCLQRRLNSGACAEYLIAQCEDALNRTLGPAIDRVLRAGDQ